GASPRGRTGRGGGGGRGTARRHVEHRVERVQLERVVVRRSGCRRSGASVVGTGRTDLTAAVRQLRSLWHSFRKSCGRRGNIPDHPVEHIVGSIARGCVQIVDNQDEARGAVRRIVPRQGWRDLGAGLRVFRRYLTAVGPRAGGERHGLHTATSAPASPLPPGSTGPAPPIRPPPSGSRL